MKRPMNLELTVPAGQPPFAHDHVGFDFTTGPESVPIEVQRKEVDHLIHQVLETARQAAVAGPTTKRQGNLMRLTGKDQRGQSHTIKFSLVPHSPDTTGQGWTVEAEHQGQLWIIGSLEQFMDHLAAKSYPINEKLVGHDSVTFCREEIKELERALQQVNAFPLDHGIVIWAEEGFEHRGKYYTLQETQSVSQGAWSLIKLGLNAGHLTTPTPQATVLHELGHALDNELALRYGLAERYFSHSIAPEIQGLYQQTDLYRLHQQCQQNHANDPKVQERLQYLTTPEELFTQLYMQYVHMQLRDLRPLEGLDRYFQDDQRKKCYDRRTFDLADQPRIQRFFETFFRRHGLRVPQDV